MEGRFGGYASSALVDEGAGEAEGGRAPGAVQREQVRVRHERERPALHGHHMTPLYNPLKAGSAHQEQRLVFVGCTNNHALLPTVQCGLQQVFLRCSYWLKQPEHL